MKQRSKNYLRTFVNNAEGISSYKLMCQHIRQVVTGGRFVKMFRGRPRPYRVWSGVGGKPFKIYQGSSPKEGATHFDVYLMWKGNQPPKFYGFTLS